jgi:CheY-like chemotaxis protein
MSRGELVGLRILVVEDYFALAESLSLWLEQEGCVIVGPVATVEGAMQLVEANELDGAILDVNLRGLSVGPVARRLRELGRPFLFLTGHSETGGLLEEFCECAWISKPAEERELLRAIAQMRARRLP